MGIVHVGMQKTIHEPPTRHNGKNTVRAEPLLELLASVGVTIVSSDHQIDGEYAHHHSKQHQKSH